MRKMKFETEKAQGNRVVLDMDYQLSSGKGIAADNFFISLSLAKELLKQ